MDAFPNWKNLVAEEIKKAEQKIITFKRYIVFLELFQPLITKFTQEEVDQLCMKHYQRTGNLIKINIDESLHDVVTKFNQREDGQKIQLLEKGVTAPYLIFGCMFSSKYPHKLIGATFSKWLYHEHQWENFTSAKNRLFRTVLYQAEENSKVKQGGNSNESNHVKG